MAPMRAGRDGVMDLPHADPRATVHPWRQGQAGLERLARQRAQDVLLGRGEVGPDAGRAVADPPVLVLGVVALEQRVQLGDARDDGHRDEGGAPEPATLALGGTAGPTGPAAGRRETRREPCRAMTPSGELRRAWTLPGTTIARVSQSSDDVYIFHCRRRHKMTCSGGHVSRSERQALLVLEMLSDAVAAVDAGGSSEEVVCSRLAAALGATAAVVVDVRPDDGSTVTCAWPDLKAAGTLAAYVTHAAQVPPDGGAVIEMHLIGGEEWAVLLGAVRPAGATAEPGRVRLVAFARTTPFKGSDVGLWGSAERPLSLLWSLVERRLLEAVVPTQGGAVADRAAHACEMSQRERQVLALLAQGMLARAIAHRLSLSPRTVHKHLGSIYRKLGVNDRLVAVTVAQRQGLIDVRLGTSTIERLVVRPA